MISLELMVVEPQRVTLPSNKVAFELDMKNVSDRQPSLWQESIIDNNSGILIHIFDRSFQNSPGPRWLYDDVNVDGWSHFRFIDEIEKDFLRILHECVYNFGGKGVWILSDAQYGPRAKKNKVDYDDFVRAYMKSGFRINMATLVEPRNSRVPRTQ